MVTVTHLMLYKKEKKNEKSLAYYPLLECYVPVWVDFQNMSYPLIKPFRAIRDQPI